MNKYQPRIKQFSFGNSTLNPSEVIVIIHRFIEKNEAIKTIIMSRVLSINISDNRWSTFNRRRNFSSNCRGTLLFTLYYLTYYFQLYNLVAYVIHDMYQLGHE